MTNSLFTADGKPVTKDDLPDFLTDDSEESAETEVDESQIYDTDSSCGVSTLADDEIETDDETESEDSDSWYDPQY